MSGEYVVVVDVGEQGLVILGKESGTNVKTFSKVQADVFVERILALDPTADCYVAAVNSGRYILKALKTEKAKHERNLKESDVKEGDNQAGSREPAQHSFREIPCSDDPDVEGSDTVSGHLYSGTLADRVPTGETPQLRSEGVDRDDGRTGDDVAAYV